MPFNSKKQWRFFFAKAQEPGSDISMKTAKKWAKDTKRSFKKLPTKKESVSERMAPILEKYRTAAWTRSAGKDPEGGLNRKGVASYRRQNPGSKLKMAVTTPPSKLKPGSKKAKRRKSFCARMSGMPGPMKKNGKPTRKKQALDKWNC